MLPSGEPTGPGGAPGSAATFAVESPDYRFASGERLPVEVLVFEVAPEHVEEFLAVDHEVWTLGEAHTDGFDHIPPGQSIRADRSDRWDRHTLIAD